MGYPLAYHLIGLLITIAILEIVRDTGKSVFSRMLNGVEPGIVDETRQGSQHNRIVKDVAEVWVRWLEHRLYAEVNITVDPLLSFSNCHKINQTDLLYNRPSIGDNDLENQGIQSKPVHSLFCDDFLKKGIKLPWMYGTE